ncbi:tripartite tricarboxylate transporter TctB family protein [Phyllobacterium sp. 21LDTY02-6]|jgi:tellurite resistance protein TehA-like permease|uniref:tripartite tricarboxylate transporter TctB family protein n=1 Tax=unclassified Phyllobacterium TaxID=2638441 RepID=UPI002021AB68|nr:MULTISPECIES: tripartite tricarboxylate transporter TctB family protein [unclassified Phyllobacterium]MCO4318496.1 tripartite tricarboxylate transporter TctB family protein [Phyllobacterium sp. 21LDTY02-6]MCX8281413.1 tripartite tricarboxylate transporter TctB family protein [Phyllobacterium sp. 0TCS1.6C]MCX8295931.1 tripartite tricarboxylate transporter TctB family protein [Phyllobacterium sp. 0TCS1.6A]
MAASEKSSLSRRTMEIVTALITAGAGLAVCYGSWKSGIGWSETGPEAGYFPFYIGVLIVFGSLVTLLRTMFFYRHEGEIFLDMEKAKPVLGFFLPIIGFIVVSLLLGLYVGTALYIFGFMTWQGGYRWWISLLTGLVVIVLFYLVFEIGFQVPLLKGPLENAIGLY